MKNNFQKIFILLCSVLIIAIVGCDKIEGPFTENNEIIDTTRCPVPQFPALENTYRKILIEDFTGHKCGYCPRAHVALHDLIVSYGDTIVSYAMHVSDGYAAPDATGSYTYDFRTEEGTFVDNAFHISAGGLPKGMVSRVKYNGSEVIDHGSWPIVVQTMLTDIPKLGLQIINNYNSTDSSFCSHIKISFLENITDTLMFYCCLTEDSIIKPQKNYDVTPNTIPNYVHMHVYRDGLNGNLGVTINPSLTVKDSSIVKSYYYKLNGKDFVHKNLKIVAYVYKSSTNEVLQAEDEKVK